MSDPTPRAPEPPVSPLRPGRTALLAAGLGLALALLAGPRAASAGRAAWVLFAGAALLALLSPALATSCPGAGLPALGRGLLRAAIGTPVAALALTLTAWLAGAAGAPLVPGAGYLVLFGLALAGLAAAVGGRPGQLLASGLGLSACGLPWWAGSALGGWSETTQVHAILWSPLPALAGSCAGLDPLRQGGLYTAFPAAHSAPFAYDSPAQAVLAAGTLCAGAGLLLLLRLLLPRLLGPLLGPSALKVAALRAGPPRGALAGLLLLLCAGHASTARAQAIFEPTPAPDSQIGDLETRVLLGYYLPRLSGRLKLEGKFAPGNDFSFRRHMDLDPILVLPTFEVGLYWRNAGRVAIQYMESFWNGETQLNGTRRFKDASLAINSVIDSKYYYRAISLQAELHIPVYDFATLRIIQTTRYIKHETKIRAFDRLNVTSVHNSLESIIPQLGVGADVSIWGPIFVYGDIQWLDFRTSIAGGRDGRFKFHHREYKLGVRLELVDQAHVLVEWFSLEHSVKDGDGPDAEYYEQRLNGIRVQVAVLF